MHNTHKDENVYPFLHMSFFIQKVSFITISQIYTITHMQFNLTSLLTHTNTYIQFVRIKPLSVLSIND